MRLVILVGLALAFAAIVPVAAASGQEEDCRPLCAVHDVLDGLDDADGPEPTSCRPYCFLE